MFSRPCVAGAIQKHFCHSLINSVIHPLWKYLQNSGCEKSVIALGGIRHLGRLASASTGNINVVLFFSFLLSEVELVGGGSVINGVYPV